MPSDSSDRDLVTISEVEPTLEGFIRYQARYMMSELERYRREANERGDVPPLSSLTAQHAALCAHLHSEVDELVRCVNWKIHQQTQPASLQDIAYEVVDIMKFLLNVMAIHRIGPKQLIEAFQEKSLIVERRRRIESLKHDAALGRLGPALIVDLDGVLAARDTALIALACKVKTDEFHSLQEYKEAYGQAEYERLKDAFYRLRSFADLTVCEAAAEAVRRAHAKKVPIIVATSRDIKRYPTIEYDTHVWLDRAKIPYDGIVFSSEKERALTFVHPKSIALDDEESHVAKLTFVCTAVQFFMASTLDDAVSDLVERRRLWAEGQLKA